MSELVSSISDCNDPLALAVPLQILSSPDQQQWVNLGLEKHGSGLTHGP